MRMLLDLTNEHPKTEWDVAPADVRGVPGAVRLSLGLAAIVLTEDQAQRLEAVLGDWSARATVAMIERLEG